MTQINDGADRKCVLGAQPSFLSSDLSVDGKVISEGTVIVDASVSGDVVGQTVSVDENGRLVGTVRGDFVAVGGKIEGNVYCSFLDVCATGRIDGDITYSKLRIEEGGVVCGTLSRMQRYEPSTA